MILTKGNLDKFMEKFDHKTKFKRSTEKQVLNRIKSFNTWTWFGKPKEISSLECAKRGWVNVEVDTLTCLDCQANLTIKDVNPLMDAEEANELKLKLSNNHSNSCFWRNFSPLDDINNPLTRSKVEENKQKWDSVGIPVDIEITLQDTQSLDKSFKLALLNWIPLESQDGGYCDDCFREFKWIDYTPSSDVTSSSFDVLNEHRYYMNKIDFGVI